ncbi:MAG: molybdopterin-dependent oxidoreductase [Anaerolineales bacterium]|nr:molybdopterin-dependent oxidoreductase [Anaerolineales bacterium]
MSTIGNSEIRVDARAKVTGEALYPGDFTSDDQLMMKVLFAARPHAIVRSIDTSAAEKLEGVVAVYTAKDVPINRYGLGVPDQPVLCGPGSDTPFTDRVRFMGDQVAVVVAETEKIASCALDLIKVDYEDLPQLSDPEEAMKDGAILIHPDQESNIVTHYRIRRGDVEEAFKQADVVVESIYETPAQEHAYLQPEAGVGYIDEEGRVTVVVGGQWTNEDREQIAHSLDLPEEKVRVIYPAIGGAFGGREDMSVQIILGLAAMRLHERGIDRPVKIIWSREESIIGHHKRHPFKIYSRWAATKDGKLTAVETTLIQDAGAYVYTSPKVLGNATVMATGPYDIPNVCVDTYGVYTTNIPGGAFRGFGGPQAAFAAEAQMNKLAEKLGMDPVELRVRNLLADDVPTAVGSVLPPNVTIDKVVAEAAKRSGWQKTETGWKKPLIDSGPDPILRGVGFACGYKNIGFSFGYQENCTARIELHGRNKIEEAVIYHGAAEVGQGTHTVIRQMTADAIGVPLEKVRLIPSDTSTSGNAGSVSASRMTFMSGNSIRGAAEAALKKWAEEERPAVAEYTYLAPKTSKFDPVTGECVPNFAYGYVAETVVVEVDTETGHIHLRKVLCADDVGKAINPQQVEGQIEGALVQAAGYTILENFVQNDGRILTDKLSTYLIPTVLDIPDEIDSVILEYADPRGPWGARGMAEMPFIPLAPAIIDAVHDATGVWFDSFPLTPERVLEGLGKLKEVTK